MSGDRSLHAVAVNLAKGYALSEFFPLTHPTLTQALLNLTRDLLGSGEELRFEVAPGGLSRGSEPLARRSPHVERLAARLAEHGVQSLTLRADIGAEVLGRFLSAVALPPRVVRAAGGLPAALAAAHVSRVAVNGDWVHPLEAAPLPEPAAASSPAQAGAEEPVTDTGIELWSAHDMYEQVRSSAERVEQEDVAELRRLLREGSDSERVEVLQRLEFVAQYCMQHHEVDRAIALMDALRSDAEALKGKNPALRAAVMLALHRLLNPAIVEELVARLGRARSEEERAGWRSTLLHLGADVVSPLVVALTAASDVSSRRAYRDALVALDHVGVPLLEDMVGDERWFVVRNMVGILGEIRSADAFEHFARTLKHPDARVRRETIIALSKVSGEEAVPLLVQGLNDAEAGLRSSAALGLGLTKSPAAVTPLVKRLAQENDPEVVVEVLRALGRIGDARAVPVLAERAAGGFFSRTPAPIRVEAVRALGEIGGEAAHAVLQRLVRDRTAEVREAAVKAVG